MTTIRSAVIDATVLVLTDDERTAVLARIPRASHYQRDYARGWHRVSGADLAGKARSYGARYRKSRQAVESLAREVVGELVRVQGVRGALSLWSVSALALEVGA
jgi:hypothetical protein